MKTAEFLSYMRDLGVNLWIDGADLHYGAPSGVLTQALRTGLSEHKAEILALLRTTGATASSAALVVSADRTSPNPGEVFIAPRTPTEKILAGIWARVLGVKQVGVYDNFFELGGDSLLAMEAIIEAQQAGLRFASQQLFRHQTIAELAATEGEAPICAEQGLVTGSLSLTNNQCWLFSREFLDFHHWNIAKLLEVHQTLDPVLVEQVVQHLLIHHDALRTRFIREEANWQAFIADPDEVAPFTHIDLSEIRVEDQSTAIEQIAAGLQKSLDLAQGPLIRVALFDLGEHKPGRLLIIVHHLVSDARSLSILLEDFETAYRQLGRGEQVRLPHKTTSLKRVAERLDAYAKSSELREEIDYWLDFPREYSPLPVDYPRSEGNTEASVRTVTVSLSAEETDALLLGVQKAHGAEIMDALLMALVQALTQWSGGRWLQAIVLDSGRNLITDTDSIDVSRTVGLLVSGGLMMLERKESGNPGDALRSIREQRCRIPNRGIGYELLLRCSENTEVVEKLRPLLKDDVKFNYMGRVVENNSALFRRAPESTGAHQNPQNIRDILLYCPAYIAGDCLTVHWEYSANIHKHSTIERVARNFIGALRALIAYCQSQQREHGQC